VEIKGLSCPMDSRCKDFIVEDDEGKVTVK